MKLVNEDLDLEKIADSGQSFRWEKTGKNRWRVISADKVLYAVQEPDSDEVELECSEQEFNSYWKNYLDLDTDYKKIREMIDSEDKFLVKSAVIGRGIRILRQDPWEMLITFLISQRKNIPAIKSCVEKICELAGKKLPGGLYAFPTAEELVSHSEEELLGCSLGYRAKYIHETAKKFASGEYSIEMLSKLNDEELEKALLELYGVGVKVANCTMLFGFYRTDSFPIDVWMKRVLEEHYSEGFEFERYRPYNGIMQQYLFAYRKSVKS
ncbi:MAG: DNA-3-methyladenine glycosylase 2 family protein [Lachnospiraceae bacterium]|nr:DNA-3-methyladenine glycosylase 2 family protein [Lachnospiraceae bacterium]